jgi:hypothetical protein
LLSPNGLELYGKKAVSQFIDAETQILKSELPIEQASRLISAKMQQEKVLDYIITGDGKYHGIGTVIDLIKVLIDMQVQNTRHINSLTILPGNIPVCA